MNGPLFKQLCFDKFSTGNRYHKKYPMSIFVKLTSHPANMANIFFEKPSKPPNVFVFEAIHS